MKPIQNYDLINEAGEFERLPAGIYGVKITKVVDNSQGEYLEVYCDIVKSLSDKENPEKYKNYFSTLVANGLTDTSRTFRSYKTNAIPFFKAFIKAVEKTNSGFNWDWDEQKLVGKNVIAIMGEEEYEANDGSIKVATRVFEFRSLEAYQTGKLTVPERKKLETTTAPVAPENNKTEEAVAVDLDDLPF